MSSVAVVIGALRVKNTSIRIFADIMQNLCRHNAKCRLITRLLSPVVQNLQLLSLTRYKNFKHIICKTATNFFRKNVRNSCSAKIPHTFSAKNMSRLDFMCTRRLKETVTKDFVNDALNNWALYFVSADVVCTRLLVDI